MGIPQPFAVSLLSWPFPFSTTGYEQIGSSIYTEFRETGRAAFSTDRLAFEYMHNTSYTGL
jgi:hypothetical protein